MLPAHAGCGLTQAHRCYILNPTPMQGGRRDDARRRSREGGRGINMVNSDHSSSVRAGVADAGTSADEVLDAQALARLRELDPGGRTGLLERVLRAFEVSVGRLVPQLEQGRASGDLQAVAHVAHTLKSSSASIGALELSRLCADCERRVRESRADGLDAVLDALTLQIGRAVQALKHELAARA